MKILCLIGADAGKVIEADLQVAKRLLADGRAAPAPGITYPPGYVPEGRAFGDPPGVKTQAPVVSQRKTPRQR